MKRLLLPYIILVPLISTAQKGHFILDGKIGTLDAPATVYMYNRIGAKSTIDSMVLKSGAFRFQGDMAGPVKVELYLVLFEGTRMEREALFKEYRRSPEKKGDTAFEAGFRARFLAVSAEKDDIDRKYAAEHPGTIPVLLHCRKSPMMPVII